MSRCPSLGSPRGWQPGRCSRPPQVSRLHPPQASRLCEGPGRTTSGYVANGGRGARPLPCACAPTAAQPRSFPSASPLHVVARLFLFRAPGCLSRCMSFLQGQGSMSLGGEPPGAARCPGEACCVDGGDGVRVVMAPPLHGTSGRDALGSDPKPLSKKSPLNDLLSNLQITSRTRICAPPPFTQTLGRAFLT